MVVFSAAHVSGSDELQERGRRANANTCVQIRCGCASRSACARPCDPRPDVGAVVPCEAACVGGRTRAGTIRPGPVVVEIVRVVCPERGHTTRAFRRKYLSSGTHTHTQCPAKLRRARTPDTPHHYVCVMGGGYFRPASTPISKVARCAQCGHPWVCAPKHVCGLQIGGSVADQGLRK